MSTSYEDKLRDPRWQRKRLELLNAADWSCSICGDTKEELNVHHVGKVIKFARHLLAIGHGQNTASVAGKTGGVVKSWADKMGDAFARHLFDDEHFSVRF